jgi:exodeoxyribonuclease VII small subunit
VKRDHRNALVPRNVPITLLFMHYVSRFTFYGLGEDMSPKPKGKSKIEAPVETLSFEQAFAELESLVQQMEAGQLTLEESLKLFERGQALAARCGVLLESAELKVELLGAQGELTPFEAEE